MERALLKGNIARFRDLLASGEVENPDTVRRLLAEAERELEELERVSTHELARRDAMARTIAERVLDEAMRLLGAQSGCLQIFDAAAGALVILAQRNLRKPYLDYFAEVTATDPSACGRCLASRRPVSIEDVALDATFAPHRHIAKEAGFRAVQSTPLLAPSGDVIGVLSCHFVRPRQLSAEETTAIVGYCVSAAASLARHLASQDSVNPAAIG